MNRLTFKGGFKHLELGIPEITFQRTPIDVVRRQWADFDLVFFL